MKLNSKMRLEGTVKSVDVMGSRPINDDYNAKEVPYVRMSIQNNSGRQEKVEMYIDAGDGKLIPGALMEQTVVFEKESTCERGLSYTLKKLFIKSGQHVGIGYESRTWVRLS
jgi:hypothetical protein